jgi:hypothetical protein
MVTPPEARGQGISIESSQVGMWVRGSPPGPAQLLLFCPATALSNRGNLFQQLLDCWLALARHQCEESGLSLWPGGRGWCRPQSLLAAGWAPSIKQ